MSADRKPVDVLSRRWIAEQTMSANGMHEIRAGAVNERYRPLVGFAASYELASVIARSHNDGIAEVSHD